MTPPESEPTRPPLLVLTPSARGRLVGLTVTLLGLLALPYVVPSLESLRPWHPGGSYVPFWNVTARQQAEREEREERQQVEGFEELALNAEQEEEPEPAADEAPVEARPAAARPPAEAAPAEPAAPARAFPEYVRHADDSGKVLVEIERPEALDHYFGQLTLSELKLPGAITRAGQWGDSVLGGDGLTHALRQRLQARFGDAGHGFHALSKYSVGYVHHGLRFEDRGGWSSCEIIFKCRPDGRYGYAGVNSSSAGGAESLWRTNGRGFGDKASRFELWYAKAPQGGRFQVKIDDGPPRIINTRSAAPSDAVEVFALEDGPHLFQVRALGDGVARGYGVVLERDRPGVVWDELSLIGSFTQRLDYQEREHIGWQLRRRDIDLMVFMFGGNDVQREYGDLKTKMTPYENEYNRVISKFRAGRPEASCMVMSLIDHGARVENTVRTRSIVPRLVAAQRRVAEAQGCSFFDTFQAMGGENSIARWHQARPQLAAPDFSHPTPAGQAVIATLLYRAMMKRYAEFRERMTGEPLPVPQSYKELEPAPAAALAPAAEGSEPR
ncbi:MAG TPA: GDSL-type esterase/lipase family protein [Polyangiaceae bacterium]|nr:GDSL-type esterase/lipase family protein [Polyangiaceae bacterium]